MIRYAYHKVRGYKLEVRVTIAILSPITCHLSPAKVELLR